MIAHTTSRLVGMTKLWWPINHPGPKLEVSAWTAAGFGKSHFHKLVLMSNEKHHSTWNLVGRMHVVGVVVLTSNCGSRLSEVWKSMCTLFKAPLIGLVCWICSSSPGSTFPEPIFASGILEQYYACFSCLVLGIIPLAKSDSILENSYQTSLCSLVMLKLHREWWQIVWGGLWHHPVIQYSWLEINVF